MKKCELSGEFKQQVKKSIFEFEEKLKMPPTCGEFFCEFQQQEKKSNAEFEEKKMDMADLRCKIVSSDFKQQLKKSICEFEEKLKTTPTRGELSWEFEQHVKEFNAEYEEKLKEDGAELERIIQHVEYAAESLMTKIDRQDSIVKKWWKKWQKKGKRQEELAQVMQTIQVMQQQAEHELMKKVMQQHAEQELMRKVIQLRVQEELRKLNLPHSYHFNYWPSFSFAST